MLGWDFLCTFATVEKLGTIVSKSKLRYVNGYIRVVDDISKADTSKPTLLVGIDVARSVLGAINVYDRHPSDNIWWTFGKTEKRGEMETDITSFCEMVLDMEIQKVRYHYVSVEKLTLSRKKDLWRVMFLPTYHCCYLTDDMLYAHIGDSDVIGISLPLLDYYGVNIEKALSKLKDKGTNRIYDEESSTVRKLTAKTQGKAYAIPYLITRLNRLK